MALVSSLPETPVVRTFLFSSRMSEASLVSLEIKNNQSNRGFFVVKEKQNLITTFVDITALLSASFAINFHISIFF
jgi:hypothetical protein